MFEAGLEALSALSTSVTVSLNQYLKQFLVPLSKRLNDPSIRDKITKTLQTVETNGGRDATAVIKSKIPTYNSIVCWWIAFSWYGMGILTRLNRCQICYNIPLNATCDADHALLNIAKGGKVTKNVSKASSSMVNAIEILFAYGETHCWPYVLRVGFVRGIQSYTTGWRYCYA